MARNRYYEDEKTKKLSKSQLRHALKFVVPYRKLLSVLFILMIPEVTSDSYLLRAVKPFVF